MIHPAHLRDHVIRPTLEYLDLWSKSAENLLLLTCAVESDMGTYLVQNGGPALGIYQMEPATEEDIWENYLKYRSDLSDDVSCFKMQWIDHDWEIVGNEIVGNLYYATAMARIHYLRVSQELPEAYDIKGLAQYWKDHYNTHKGSGEVSEAMEKYNYYVIRNL